MNRSPSSSSFRAIRMTRSTFPRAALASAQGLLQMQCNGQPESLRLARQARAVYAALGLPEAAAT